LTSVFNTNEIISYYHVKENKKSEDKAMYKWRQLMVTKPLSDLSEGESGKIVRIRGKAAIHRYLYGMGLAVGRRISIKKVENTPLGSSVTVETGGRISTLSKDLILNIRVEVPATLDERVIPNLPKKYTRVYQEVIGNTR
jgi:Fe2+ transport system protein FeoA